MKVTKIILQNIKNLSIITIIINNYLLAILGCISLFCIFYIRFIRERLPQNIPFLLTELRFYAILLICASLLYIIKLTIFISTSIREGNSYLLNIVIICHSKAIIGLIDTWPSKLKVLVEKSTANTLSFPIKAEEVD